MLKGSTDWLELATSRMVMLPFLLLILSNPRLVAQQPQAGSGQPVFHANAEYVQGVAPGYWPTAGSGLTLNLSRGTSVCSNAVQTYPGGTLTMTANATNYVFLDATNNCVPTSNTTGFDDNSIPIAVVTTNASSITAITDVRTWFQWRSAGTAGPPASGVVVDATQFPGPDAEARIAAAMAFLPARGGVVDARGFEGSQTWGATLVITKPVHLLLGNATFTFAGPGPMIWVKSNSGSAIIEGTGFSNAGSTILQSDTNDDGIRFSGDFISSSLQVRYLTVLSTVQHSQGACINADVGNAATSVGVDIEDMACANGWFYGVRLAMPLKSTVRNVQVVHSIADSFRVEGGTSTHLDTVYASGSAGNGIAFTNFYGPSQLQGPYGPSSPGSNFAISHNPGGGTLVNGTVYRFYVTAVLGGNETAAAEYADATAQTNDAITISWARAYMFRWQPGLLTPNNEVIEPDPPNGHYYKGSGGTTGSVQPTWPTGSGSTVNDNGITWTEQGTTDFVYKVYAVVGGDTGPRPPKLIATTAAGATSYTLTAPPSPTTAAPAHNLVASISVGGPGYSGCSSCAADFITGNAYQLEDCSALSIEHSGAEGVGRIGLYGWDGVGINPDNLKIDTVKLIGLREGGIRLDNSAASAVILEPTLYGSGNSGSYDLWSNGSGNIPVLIGGYSQNLGPSVGSFTNIAHNGTVYVSGAGIGGGTGDKSGSCSPTGSLWLRTDGGAGSTFYVCEGGTWAAK